MRYKRAVEKLRILAETCERTKVFWFDTEPFLKAVYAFGDVVDGTDPLEAVQVAVAINLSPPEVPWESRPQGTDWLAEQLRLSKGGFLYFWRSQLREIRDNYWDHDWRREHRGYGRYPENDLWDAVEGDLDLLDAFRSSHPDG